MHIELNKLEIDIILNGLMTLNHNLLNDLVKKTDDYELVKERIIALNFLVDKLTPVNNED